MRAFPRWTCAFPRRVTPPWCWYIAYQVEIYTFCLGRKKIHGSSFARPFRCEVQSRTNENLSAESGSSSLSISIYFSPSLHLPPRPRRANARTPQGIRGSSPFSFVDKERQILFADVLTRWQDPQPKRSFLGQSLRTDIRTPLGF